MAIRPYGMRGPVHLIFSAIICLPECFAPTKICGLLYRKLL
ncbi:MULTISPECIES: hypothetical protein [Planktothricoides]|nr:MULTISPECIES: hypothetical protein [Planktothricoides]